LFAAIGTNYGIGDGVTTFNLPDLQGRLPQGRDAGDVDFDVLGEVGGQKEESITLTADQIPVHLHILTGKGGGDDVDNLTADGPVSADGGTFNSIVNSPGGVMENVGDDNTTISQEEPFTVPTLPPYVIVNYVIQT
jgi:microcystin-dependent protein